MRLTGSGARQVKNTPMTIRVAKALMSQTKTGTFFNLSMKTSCYNRGRRSPGANPCHHFMNRYVRLNHTQTPASLPRADEGSGGLIRCGRCRSSGDFDPRAVIGSGNHGAIRVLGGRHAVGNTPRFRRLHSGMCCLTRPLVASGSPGIGGRLHGSPTVSGPSPGYYRLPGGEGVG